MSENGAPPAGAFFHDLHPPRADFKADALKGLAARPARLSPKYFYDARGSALFEDITRLAEYYVTRTEMALLEAIAPALTERVGPDAAVIELGSGSERKIRLLLSTLDRPTAYVAVDISPAPVKAALASLAGDFPGLTLGGVCADFTKPIPEEVFAALGDTRRVVFFPGSTLGNFEGDEALALLRAARGAAGEGGGLILGVDLVKPESVLIPAYDDAAGVTAAFNKNVLIRLRDELGAEIDPDAFTHRAVWVPETSCVEMRLVATRPTTIRLDAQDFAFDRDDYIHTENSRKFTLDDVTALTQAAGFVRAGHWTDPKDHFAILWLEAQ